MGDPLDWALVGS